jgi:hypothetical protein
MIVPEKQFLPPLSSPVSLSENLIQTTRVCSQATKVEIKHVTCYIRINFLNNEIPQDSEKKSICYILSSGKLQVKNIQQSYRDQHYQNIQVNHAKLRG